MPTFRTLAGLGAATLSLLGAIDNAHALPLPDTSSCATPGACLSVTNTQSSSSVGVQGQGQSAGVTGYSVPGTGVYGYSESATGVYGGSNGSYGVWGSTSATTAVFGQSQTSYGVMGATDGTRVSGVSGYNSTTGVGYGVTGNAPSATGTGAGVKGEGPSSYGVYGFSVSGTGTYGTSSTGHGVDGRSVDSSGVYGTSVNGYGVEGVSSLSNRTGVYARNTGTGNGILATATSGSGVYASATTGYGVSAFSQSGDGILGVTSSSTRYAVFARNDSTGFGVVGSTHGTGRAVFGDNSNATGWAGYFNGKVFGNSFTTPSDARLKRDIQPMRSGLERVLALRPVTFKWKSEGSNGKVQLGLIAQELQKVIPEVVDTDVTTGKLSVNYSELLPVVIDAVQEQQRIIQQQETRIAALERARGATVASFWPGGNSGWAACALLALALYVSRRRSLPAA